MARRSWPAFCASPTCARLTGRDMMNDGGFGKRLTEINAAWRSADMLPRNKPLGVSAPGKDPSPVRA